MLIEHHNLRPARNPGGQVEVHDPVHFTSVLVDALLELPELNDE